MGGKPGQQGTGTFAAKHAAGETLSRSDAVQAEPGHQYRMQWEAEGGEQVCCKFVPGIFQRRHQLHVWPPVGKVERFGGWENSFFQYGCGAVVKRVGEGRRRVNPVQPMTGKGEGVEKR